MQGKEKEGHGKAQHTQARSEIYPKGRKKKVKEHKLKKRKAITERNRSNVRNITVVKKQ